MGPKAGEQYGAPFDEEEWEDAELDFQVRPMPSVTIAVPAAENTSSSHRLNNPVQSPELQAGPIPSTNLSPCRLQAHTPSGMECTTAGAKELSSSFELSFDILNLQKVLQLSAPPVEENHNNALPDTEDVIFEDLGYVSGDETEPDPKAEMCHSEDCDMVNGDAFDPATILSELQNENFVELSDFLAALGFASDGLLMSKGSFNPSMLSHYSDHFR